MTEYGLEPAFLRLDYTSVFGPHAHLIPLKEWISTSLTGTMGSFIAWDASTVDAEAMIDALVAVFAPVHKDDTTYTQATIFTKADEASPSLPVASKSLSVAGSSILTTHAKAIQAVLNMRSLGIQPVKLVFLDVPHPATDFLKEAPGDFDANWLAIVAEFTDAGNAWSARDNTRPNSAVSITWDINKSLRKRYGMA